MTIDSPISKLNQCCNINATVSKLDNTKHVLIASEQSRKFLKTILKFLVLVYHVCTNNIISGKINHTLLHVVYMYIHQTSSLVHVHKCYNVIHVGKSINLVFLFLGND